MSKTFCIAPWHDVHVITDGTFKGCCVMSNGEQEGRLCNNGKPLTVAEAGIKGAINSDTSKQLRLDMLLMANGILIVNDAKTKKTLVCEA